MSRHTRSKRNRQSRRVQGRRRVVGLGGGVGAVLTFGLGPLGVAPTAHADEFDVIIDPIINAIANSLGGVVDPLAGIDPSAVADLGALSTAATDVTSTSGLGLSGVDSALTLPADPWAGVGASADPATASDPFAAASSFDSELQALERSGLPAHSVHRSTPNSTRSTRTSAAAAC